MKKKLLWFTGSLIVIAVIILCVCRYVPFRQCQTDPNRELAEQIYRTESLLKIVDENCACESLSKVTPFFYTDPAGNKITYYCCQTFYLSDAYKEHTGLNTDVIGMVIDFEQIENRQECKVSTYDAFQCEIGEQSYLCWTISPEISCVIAYDADTVAETDIFRMAESVQSPAE